MARIVQFVTNLHIGGTERQVVNLTRGLRDAGFETRIACFSAQGGMAEEVGRLGVPVSEFPIPSLWNPSVLKPLWDVARFLRRHRIDLVQTSGFYTNVLGVVAARMARTPVVVASVRDMGHMWTPAQRRVQMMVGVLADAVVANAEAVAGRLRDEGWNAARIVVIPNGIAYRPRPARGRDLRRELGLAPGTPLVGVVTRLTRLKGVEDFIDAAAVVAARRPEVRFVIVGGPVLNHLGQGADYDRELARRAETIGLGERVHFLGWRSDASDLLSQLTISVLPSLSEGLSNVLIESLAAGIPTVATTVGGNSEVVDDGVTGLLVPACDPARLAAAIGRILDSRELAAKFGAAGRRRFEDGFTMDRMVQEMIRLYRRLLDPTPAPRFVRRALTSERGVRR